MFFDENNIFHTEGSSYYRIPSIVTTKRGTVLAFCNDRKDGLKDAVPECDLVLCRKEKDGQWSNVQCMKHIPGWTHLIGIAVYDEMTDTVMCSFKRIAIRLEEYGDYTDEERKEIAEKEQKLAEEAGVGLGQFLLISTDDGLTWTEQPLVLSPALLKKEDGTEGEFEGYSHGAGPAIQLRHGKYAGRLLCAAKAKTGHYTNMEQLAKRVYNIALYSDDHGKTWVSSGPVQLGTAEGTMIERTDGSILYNSRAYFHDQKRYLAVSRDGGATYSDFSTDSFLMEPARSGCNASMLRIERHMIPEEHKKWLPEQASAITLFANPRAEDRRNMTICVSFDDGESWVHTRCVRKERAAYSSLTYSYSDGHFYLLYELGENNPYDMGLTVAEFDLDWLFGEEAI